MYIKKCKWCEKEITVEKQCIFALHVCNCDSNPNKFKRIEKYKEKYTGKIKVERITFEQECPKCSEHFDVVATKSQIKLGRYRKFCSIKCANSHIVSDELKLKISEACKKSEKVKIANNIQTEGRKYRIHIIKDKVIKEFTCLYCGEKGINKKNIKNRKYHKECWLKISGGIREGSSRGKHGWYKGYWCDSSYELAFLIFNLEHDIEIERNRKGYEYYYKNKKHKFYPDFRVDGKLVEIKNFRSELTDAKLNSVDEEIKIYYKDTIKPYINYVVDKYGKKFIELYEK